MRFGSVIERPQEPTSPPAGFTILELLAAGTVFAMILVITLVMTSHLGRVTTDTTSSVAAFQEARTAFETMNRMLSQAVLNTYWDYDDPVNPANYLRASELHFVVGPAQELTGLGETAGSAVFCQAPLGLTNSPELKFQPSLLNALGFYVRFSFSEDLPDFLAGKRPETGAWRLWMFQQPTEDLAVYERFNTTPQAPSDLTWIQGEIGNAAWNHVLGNNVIFLLIRAGHSDESGDWRETYVYNSRGTTPTDVSPQAVQIHQLPPVLQVTLVAIDQRTADRLLAHSGGNVYNLFPENADLFSDAEKYPEDMEKLLGHLDSRPLGGIPISYRVFESAVNLTTAKWSL